jgi:ornithine cyclodeaminase
MQWVSQETEGRLDWMELLSALKAGHLQPRAQIADSVLVRGPDTILTRVAWIEGMGALAKTATVFPDNLLNGLSSVNGGVSLFSDEDGRLEAILDFHLVTKWKTAGDSLLAASLLARPDSQNITLVGAGTVARSMVEAYRARFPAAALTVWSRSLAAAVSVQTQFPFVAVTEDLRTAVEQADIVCTATMATTPLVKGEWLRPGQHLDLIGAFRADMREVDDEVLKRARIFVDSRETTLDHIGELKDPLERGVIGRGDVRGDFYDISAGLYQRTSDDEITLAKNGGGAHLDLMTSRYILDKAKERG